MSVSYGTITITDTTDLGQLSVYLSASTVRQQIYDAGSNPPTTVTYYPNWDTATGGTPLVITPHAYFNGASVGLDSNKIRISWSKIEGGVTYPYGNGTYATFPCSPSNAACPESLAGTSSKELQRPANLSKNSVGATYIATITYYPIDSDLNTTITATATLDLTISNNGTDGAAGTPAKSLSLIGDGSHFAYTWNGTAIAPTTINLTVEKQNIEHIRWYCDNTLISGQTGDSLQVTTTNITNYCPNFTSKKSAQFKVVETDSSGIPVTNGFVDYYTIYRIAEAQPGDSIYAAYLDNDQETVNEYNNILDLSNAETTFFLTKNGVDELTENSGWTLTITDSNPSGATDETKEILYTKTHVGDGYSGYLNHIEVTALRSNTAWIEFTASKSGVTSLTKRFTINKNPQLISHALRLDSVTANRNSAGTYVPSQITVDAIERTGGGTDTYRTAGVIHAKIYYKTGDPSSFLSNTDGNALLLTLADNNSRPISYIETFLGGTAAENYTDAEDKQKITISTDGTNGQDGESPWNFMTGNQFDAISTDFSNITSQSFTIQIPIKAAEGAVLKDIHHGGTTYPTINASTILNNSNIGPKYYMGNNDVSSTTGAIVDNIRYIIPANTNIGADGEITLELTYASGKVLTQVYNYKAQPEILKPIRVLLQPSPSNTFENQEGEITVTPIVLSGTSEITSGLTGIEWWVYVENASTHEMEWTKVTSTTTTDNIYLSGNNIVVKGQAVQGYLGLRFNVNVTKGGNTETYTEYINLEDIDDPLQVTLHSTVGEQLVNGQGAGVLYARVIRRGDDEDYDTIVPDNMLAVGTSAPTTSTASGKTGYFHIVQSGSGSSATPTGQIDYYSRTEGTGAWTKRTTQKYTYTWYFRDANNASYVKDASGNPVPINYAMNNNTQFVYISSATVKDKITATVKVEL